MIHLGICIKIHKKVHLRLRFKGCSWSCTSRWTGGCIWGASVLHFLVNPFTSKSAQSDSANGGPYVALEGTFNGGVNVTLECAL